MISRLGTSSTWLGVALAGIYLFRCATGLFGGLAHAQASPLAREGYYREAIPLLERADVGFDRFETLWLRAESRLGLWDDAFEKPGAVPAMAPLAIAAGEFLQAASLSPASAWPWTGLAEVYDRVERAARRSRPLDLSRLVEGPWGEVGRAGRIAIGLAREAIGREPAMFFHRDRLVVILGGYGLREEALAELEASARIQPIPVAHTDIDVNSMPKEFLEAFLRGALAAYGHAPLTARYQQLLALGQLEWRLGRLADAEKHLRQAVLQPAGALNRAESWYYLGVVLIERKDFGGAVRALDEAARSPAFAAEVAQCRARIAEAEGKPEDALAYFREARRFRPADMGIYLELARAARGLRYWDEAESALKFAITLRPEDLRPRVALVETYLEAGDLDSAVAALQDAETAVGKTREFAGLWEKLKTRRRRS